MIPPPPQFNHSHLLTILSQLFLLRPSSHSLLLLLLPLYPYCVSSCPPSYSASSAKISCPRCSFSQEVVQSKRHWLMKAALVFCLASSLLFTLYSTLLFSPLPTSTPTLSPFSLFLSSYRVLSQFSFSLLSSPLLFLSPLLLPPLFYFISSLLPSPFLSIL